MLQMGVIASIDIIIIIIIIDCRFIWNWGYRLHFPEKLQRNKIIYYSLPHCEMNEVKGINGILLIPFLGDFQDRRAIYRQNIYLIVVLELDGRSKSFKNVILRIESARFGNS